MSAEPIFEQLFEKMLFAGQDGVPFRWYCLWRCQSNELQVELDNCYLDFIHETKFKDAHEYVKKILALSNKPLPGIHTAYLMLPAMFHRKVEIEIIFKLSEALAKNNIALAQFNLGYMYKNGLGIPLNKFPQKDEIAVAWFRKAADQGLVLAQFSLGSMYENGRGISDEEVLDKEVMAFYWYARSAEQGDKLCIRFKDDLKIKEYQLKKAMIMVERDLSYRQVKFWFEEQRALRVWLLLILNIESQRAGYSGDKTNQNLPIDLLYKIAEFIVPLSAAELKDLYDKVIKPLPKEIAFKAQYAKNTRYLSFFKFNYVTKRVKSGAPLLLTEVEKYAEKYPKSLEAQVYNEFKKSVKHPEVSKEPADQELALTQFALGKMYQQGRGIPSNEFPQKDVIAVAWYRKAADQGLAQAQFNLGNMYQQGRGIPSKELPQKDEIAVSWYRKAADQGLVQAQCALENMYQLGRSIPPNEFPDRDKIAVAWYRKAADQGDASAQFELGCMYEKGYGISDEEKLDNAVMALYWYSRGAKQGDKRCIEKAYYLTINEYQQKKAAMMLLRDLSYRQVKFWFEEQRALRVWLLLILNIESQGTGYSGDKTIQNLPIELLFKIARFIVPLSAAELKDLYNKVIKPLPKEIAFKAQYAKNTRYLSLFKFNYVAKRVKSGAPLLLTEVEKYAKINPKSMEAQVYNEFKQSVKYSELSKEPDVQQRRIKK